MLKKFKGSAIHNLVITRSDETKEGLIVPSSILRKVDIADGQEVIVTKIGAGSWKNRIKTFIISDETSKDVVVCGSLAKFLNPGDLTCLIAEVYNDEKVSDMYHQDKFPIFDLGFDPQKNIDNSISTLDLQYYSKTSKDVKIDSDEFLNAKRVRGELLKVFATSVILGLVVNKTHPDCLQGSAELPESVMKSANIERYKSVSVYNNTLGGIADTYAVPMPEGVVMTTGAMASFADIGNSVNIVSYVLDKVQPCVKWIHTDGTKTK